MKEFKHRTGSCIKALGMASGIVLCTVFPSAADDGYAVDFEAGVTGVASSGDFAPYYIASNRHGVITQGNSALLDVAARRKLDRSERFSYGFGAEFIGGWSNSVDYMRWNGEELQMHPEHPARAWVQQLYGEVKYRGVFLTAGLKERTPALVSATLSSGDLVESGNSRPVPEVRVGFIDFQDIPFTGGWVQIQGELSYGKLADNAWVRNHYNYYQSHMAQGVLYTYKRCFFRTNPHQPFSVTVGMQVGGMFGGTTRWFDNGVQVRERKFASGIKQFFKMLVPSDGGSEYYSGSSLGSWDLQLRYNLPDGMTVKAYMQKPWEDGSGIGCLNGFDGLWGLELKTGRRGIVSGAVLEYLDFTNQSGPMHWDPDDHPGTGITGRAEGADDYYNNAEYNSWAYYGMAIGSPFMRSPIYNTDGSLMFLNNRVRGFHAGVEGNVTPQIAYRVLGGYRKSRGSGYLPLVEPLSDTSVMLEAEYSLPKTDGLRINARVAYDHGKLYGNNFGACVTVSYRGALKL